MRKLKICLILLLVAGLTLQFTSGCIKRPSGGKAVKVASFLSDKSFLDPALAYEDEEIQIVSQIFDGLVRYDVKTGEVKPAIAKSWKVSEDGKTFTFYLREGVKFHDGKELKASDVKFSWERVTSPDTGSPVSYILSPIEGVNDEGVAEAGLTGVEILGDYTLRVKLKYPFADFPASLAHTAASIVSSKAVNKYGDDFGKRLIGAGPFKLEKWNSGEYITLVRNDNYYGKKPSIEKITFKIYTSPEVASADFRAGNLDIIRVPAGQFGLYKKDEREGKIKIAKRASLSTYFFGFNVEKDPFKGDSGKILRQALNYALDRSDISERVMRGAAYPAYDLVPPAISGRKKPVSFYKFNLKKAKDMVKKAYPQGAPEITLTYPAEAAREDLVAAAQAQWKEAGIKVKAQSMEEAAYGEAIAKGEISFFGISWIADYVSEDNFLYPLFHSSQIGKNNFCYYRNSEVDKLLGEARVEKGRKRRKDLYEKAEKIILKDAPVIPVFFDMNVWAAQEKFSNFKLDAVGVLALDELEIG